MRRTRQGDCIARVAGLSLNGAEFPDTGCSDPGAPRDIALYETILSGDLNRDDGDFGTGWADDGVRVENSYHVVTATNVGNADPPPYETAIDGFTIYCGYANGTHGGGLLNENSIIAVRNCTFYQNYAGFGGGMMNASGEPTISDCVFRENLAAGVGGGIDCVDVLPAITNCLFESNEAGSTLRAARHP